MNKGKVMDLNQGKKLLKKDSKHNKRKKIKAIKNEDGHYYIGDYEELLAFNNNKSSKPFEWSD